MKQNKTDKIILESEKARSKLWNALKDLFDTIDQAKDKFETHDNRTWDNNETDQKENTK